MPMQHEHDNNTVPSRRPSPHVARGRIWRVVTIAINFGHLMYQGLCHHHSAGVSPVQRGPPRN
jgi:hypothetical protein